MNRMLNKSILPFFLIVIIGIIAYSNTFYVPFLFDDINSIVENSNLRDLSKFWPPAGLRYVGFLSFALNYYFGGTNVIGYHIVNIAIHILNALLVYWLVILTFKTPYFSKITSQNVIANPFVRNDNIGLEFMNLIALFSALLFVSHPVQTQAVTYIVQRFTNLSAFFYLLSVFMYIKARLIAGSQEKRQEFFSQKLMFFYLVSFFSAIFAMKTKEIAFTLPLVIALYDFIFLNELSGSRFIRAGLKRLFYLIPFFMAVFFILLSTFAADRQIGSALAGLGEASMETAELSRWSYLMTEFRVVVTYVRLLFFPVKQNLDYDYPIYSSFLNHEVFLSFFFISILFAFAIYLLYKSRAGSHTNLFFGFSRLTAFGILWFFITLSVESSVIPIRDVINEHRLYLPGIGIIIAFSSTAFYAWKFISDNLKPTFSASLILQTVPYLFISIIVVPLLVAAYQRNSVWKDEISLWEDVKRKSPQKARAYNCLGNAYRGKGWTDKAIEHYQMSVILNPRYSDAYYNLGLAYSEGGQTDKAIEYYKIALKLSPYLVNAHNNLGNEYYKKGRIDDAIKEYRTALSLKPDYKDAQHNLSAAYKLKEKANAEFKN